MNDILLTEQNDIGCARCLNTTADGKSLPSLIIQEFNFNYTKK